MNGIRYKKTRCFVCRENAISFPIKLKDIGYGADYVCANCNSRYTLNRLWYHQTGILKSILTDGITYAVLTFGIALGYIIIGYPLFWVIRLLTTLNRPYRLVERNFNYSSKKQ